MLMAFGAIIAGLVLLVWSADKFVEGAAATAKHLGMPTLLIGMVIRINTSTPLRIVSSYPVNVFFGSESIGGAI